MQEAGSTTDSARNLRMLRLMRVFRLIKLIRLLRASRLFRRWETKLAINYSRLAIVRSFLMMTLVSHWFACVWGLQVRASAQPGGCMRACIHALMHVCPLVLTSCMADRARGSTKAAGAASLVHIHACVHTYMRAYMHGARGSMGGVGAGRKAGVLTSGAWRPPGAVKAWRPPGAVSLVGRVQCIMQPLPSVPLPFPSVPFRSVPFPSLPLT